MHIGELVEFKKKYSWWQWHSRHWAYQNSSALHRNAESSVHFDGPPLHYTAFQIQVIPTCLSDVVVILKSVWLCLKDNSTQGFARKWPTDILGMYQKASKLLFVQGINIDIDGLCIWRLVFTIQISFSK